MYGLIRSWVTSYEQQKNVDNKLHLSKRVGKVGYNQLWFGFTALTEVLKHQTTWYPNLLLFLLMITIIGSQRLSTNSEYYVSTRNFGCFSAFSTCIYVYCLVFKAAIVDSHIVILGWDSLKCGINESNLYYSTYIMNFALYIVLL